MTARSRSGLGATGWRAKWPTERSASAWSGTEASERISDRWLVAERTVRPLDVVQRDDRTPTGPRCASFYVHELIARAGRKVCGSSLFGCSCARWLEVRPGCSIKPRVRHSGWVLALILIWPPSAVSDAAAQGGAGFDRGIALTGLSRRVELHERRGELLMACRTNTDQLDLFGHPYVPADGQRVAGTLVGNPPCARFSRPG